MLQMPSLKMNGIKDKEVSGNAKGEIINAKGQRQVQNVEKSNIQRQNY